MQCFKLNIAYNHLWNGAQHNTQCLHCTMKGMMHWGWYMWGHVPKTHPPLVHISWGKMGRWCHHMQRLEMLAKKIHFAHVWVGLTCIPTLSASGWANLLSCSHCHAYVGFQKNNLAILGQDVRPCVQKAPSSWKSTPIHTSSYSNWTSLDTTKMQVAFQLWYWISMPFCIADCHSNSCLVSTSSYWSHSIFKEWDGNASCSLVSSFPCSKILTFTFYCYIFSHNSTTSHFIGESIVCKCPYKFVICSSTNLALDSNCATYVCVWCSTTSPNPHLSMTFVMAPWRLFGSTINLVCLSILKHARKIAINIYFIVMGIKRHTNENGHH
jgi:hypothetical protein